MVILYLRNYLYFNHKVFFIFVAELLFSITLMTLKPQFLVLNIATRYVLATLHFHVCISFKSLVLLKITICFCEVSRFVALFLDAHIIKTSHASLPVWQSA